MDEHRTQRNTSMTVKVNHDDIYAVTSRNKDPMRVEMLVGDPDAVVLEQISIRYVHDTIT